MTKEGGGAGGVKGGQNSLASVERNGDFALERRHENGKYTRVKQMLLSLTKTCCSVLADYSEYEKLLLKVNQLKDCHSHS